MTFLNRKDILWIAVLALLLLVVFPLGLDAFRLNLFGKYLTYGFVVLGLVLCWGD
ncbi:MAG: urea ABC transporter permease subunit UrtC, partial [Janthinobacterium lividum]